MLTAEHRSTCATCGDPIEPGQPIQRSAGLTTWVHADCSNPSGRRPAKVCPVCFLERPCAC